MNTNIEQGEIEYRNTNNAILLDVRTEEEYSLGHLADSINIPLSKINTISYPKDTPIFVYCRSGNRSGQGKALMNLAGYHNVTNIGGIIDYHKGLVK